MIIDDNLITVVEEDETTEEETKKDTDEKIKKDKRSKKSNKISLSDDDDSEGNSPTVVFIVIGVVLAFVISGIMCFVHDMQINKIEPTNVTYTDFKESVEKGEVWAVYTHGDNEIYYYKNEDLPEEVKTGITENMTAEEKEKAQPQVPADVSVLDLDVEKFYRTTYSDIDSVKEFILEHNVEIVPKAFVSWLTLGLVAIVTMIPLMLFGTCCFMLLMMNSDKWGPGKSNKYELSKDVGIRFDDVIGHDEIVEDIRNYTILLGMAKKLKDNHITPPKGILFTGEPGTGKTLLAKAMAGEAKVPFIYLNTSNVIELYVGVGAKTIRTTFKKARQLAPCIVFLDEIDAIGGNRTSSGHLTSEDTQTLLALLQELDGFKANSGILVIAATNCPETLDPAITRAGRFDREVAIRPPRNRAVRKAMLEHYTKDFSLDPTLDMDALAAQLAGMTGADIATICNEAAIVHIMHSAELTTKVKSEESYKKYEKKLAKTVNNLSADAKMKIVLTLDDFTTAIDKLLLKGNRLKNKNGINIKDRELVAYHESGHAVVTYLTGMPIARISIQGTTSGVGGFVLQEDKDSQFKTITDLENSVKIMYAGRNAEMLKFGAENITTGASNDIQQATNVLMNSILRYGFDDELGMLDYRAMIDNHLIDKATLNSKLIKMSRDLNDECRLLLKDKWYLVEALAETVLDCETMTGTEVISLLQRVESEHTTE